MQVDITTVSLLPPKLHRFLSDRYGDSLCDLLKAIQIVLPSEFISKLNNSDYLLSDVGYNGSIFLLLDQKHPQILKISHRVLAAFGKANLNPVMLKDHLIDLIKIRQDWASLQMGERSNSLGRKVWPRIDCMAGITPAVAELWGTLLWSMFRPQDLLLPDILTNDGLGFMRKYIEGFTLKQLIDDDKKGQVDPSKMAFIWTELAVLQKTAECMLTELGFTVDLLNPANILIAGQWPDWQLQLIDQEIVAPTQEAIDYRKKMGLPLGNIELRDLICYVTWPLIPEHITLSRVWGLSFEQAILYLQTYYQIPRYSAVDRLAGLPILNNEVNPYAQDYSNREDARKTGECSY